MNDRQLRSDCPINFVSEILGDKWSLLIIRDLLLSGKTSYGEFLASEEKIATNILSNRLSALEEAGLIAKNQDPTNKTKYIYSLTSKGVDLTPLFVEIILWSAKYRPVPATHKTVVAKARKDKQKLIEEIRNNLKAGNKSSPEARITQGRRTRRA